VFDRQTGLEWRRCSLGRVLRNGRCVGQEREVTWLEAVRYADGDWRAPTPEELHSLWQQDPSGDPRHLNIDATAFPDLIANRLYFFWTTEGKTGTGVSVSFQGPSTTAVWPNWRKDRRLPLLVVRPGKADDPAQAPSEAAGAPVSSGRFLLRGEEAEDVRTHLVWQRCPVGMRYAASTGCVGVLQPLPLADARRLGRDGWRLPTRDEILTLMVESRAGHPPMIDESAFPGMGTNYLRYWTTTLYDSGPQVWCGDFTFGRGTNCGPYPMMARLVRSRATGPGDASRPAPPASTPAPEMSTSGRFRVRGAVAEDVRTRLIWQRCPVGMAYSAGNGCAGAVQRFSQGEARGFGSDGWRLPTRDELLTLVVERRGARSPLVDDAVFPGMGTTHLRYVTSTAYDPMRNGEVWCVDFARGTSSSCGSEPVMVRLVQPLN
jgi:hypothetical protein